MQLLHARKLVGMDELERRAADELVRLVPWGTSARAAGKKGGHTEELRDGLCHEEPFGLDGRVSGARGQQRRAGYLF